MDQGEAPEPGGSPTPVSMLTAGWCCLHSAAVYLRTSAKTKAAAELQVIDQGLEGEVLVYAGR